jgi:RNA polymerase sigma-70 factor (ECF subfamily)
VDNQEIDEEFFTQNVLILYKDVYRYVLANVKNTDAAQDIVQSAMEKAWKNLKGLREPSKARQWIFAITKNEISAYFKRNMKELSVRDVSVSDKEYSYAKEHMAAVEKDILQMLITREESKRLIDALERVSAKFRCILEMWAFDDYSVKEIAKELDINYNTARVYMFRGLRELKEIYLSQERGDLDE